MIISEGTHLWKLYRWLVPKITNYRVCFGSPEGKAVLRDLAKFCFAESATKTERDLGRRDVWLRLNKFLRLSEEELTVLFAALTPEQRQQIFNPGTTFTEGS